MRGLDRMRRVLELLSGEGDRWERLQAAGFEFLLAAARREVWPSSLRAEAERVQAGLLTAGVADGGVWEADEAEVVWLARDLIRLCQQAERIWQRPAASLACEATAC